MTSPRSYGAQVYPKCSPSHSCIHLFTPLFGSCHVLSTVLGAEGTVMHSRWPLSPSAHRRMREASMITQ